MSAPAQASPVVVCCYTGGAGITTERLESVANPRSPEIPINEQSHCYFELELTPKLIDVDCLGDVNCAGLDVEVEGSSVGDTSLLRSCVLLACYVLYPTVFCVLL